MEKSCYFCASFQKIAKMGQLNQMQRYAISLMLKGKKDAERNSGNHRCQQINGFARVVAQQQ